MSGGFFGTVLLVDLSQGTMQTVRLPDSLYKDVLGGYGLGVKLLLDWMPANADSLGADNILGFVPGLLTGSGVLFGGRFMVVGKSPLTGGWGDSNCGGRFGPALRSAGLDGIFFTGVSDGPVYLSIDANRGDERAPWVLKDACHLWGLETTETETSLQAEAGAGGQVVSIGPAGENLSLIAAIITDGGRAAARSGLAAVMGAKHLKAVVVRGGERLPIHDPQALRQLNREYGQIFQREVSPFSRALFRLTKAGAPLLRVLRMKPPSPVDPVIDLYRTYGTSGATALSTELGDAPIQNWRGVPARDFPLRRSLRVSDDAVIAHQVRDYHCQYCPVGCGGILRLAEEGAAEREAHRPEYETLAAFGPLLLNDDLEAISRINSLCDRFGMDTISVGVVVAFAVECAEHGLIDGDLGGGVELAWGDAESIVTLVQRIARREGIGDLLADGVQRASERIGGGAEAFAMHAGGQELPMHDARFEPAVGLAYVVDPTPGRHNTANSGFVSPSGLRPIFEAVGFSSPGRYAFAKKGEEFALLNRYLQLVNCAGLCMFSLMMGEPPVQGWLNAATGWQHSLEDWMRIGHRIQVLRYVFNLREGIGPGDVSLPERARGLPPLEEGPLRGVSLDMDAMKRDFFDAMGYDEDGLPTVTLLSSLGLEPISRDLRI